MARDSRISPTSWSAWRIDVSSPRGAGFEPRQSGTADGYTLHRHRSYPATIKLTHYHVSLVAPRTLKHPPEGFSSQTSITIRATANGAPTTSSERHSNITSRPGGVDVTAD